MGDVASFARLLHDRNTTMFTETLFHIGGLVFTVGHVLWAMITIAVAFLLLRLVKAAIHRRAKRDMDQRSATAFGIPPCEVRRMGGHHHHRAASAGHEHHLPGSGLCGLVGGLGHRDPADLQ